MGFKKRRVKKVAQNFMRKNLSTIATFSTDSKSAPNFALFNIHNEVLQTLKRKSHKTAHKNEKRLWENLRKWEMEDNSRGLEGAPGGPADQGINPGETDCKVC